MMQSFPRPFSFLSQTCQISANRNTGFPSINDASPLLQKQTHISPRVYSSCCSSTPTSVGTLHLSLHSIRSQLSNISHSPYAHSHWLRRIPEFCIYIAFHPDASIFSSLSVIHWFSYGLHWSTAPSRSIQRQGCIFLGHPLSP